MTMKFTLGKKHLKGKLFIIAGYAPGTGKTHYACNLLSKEILNGKDVVIGYLNRQRPELADILGRIENYRPFINRPITHNEALLDVDAIINRMPDIAFVDELALPNAFSPGHHMYEGILELLENGISVYTTVNLQKFKNINIICASKTKLKQKTVIPDWVLERAEKIIFLNQSPRVIRQRFEEGRLFSQKQMQREFLQRYMSYETLTINHDICLDIIKKYNNSEIINF